MTATGFAGIVPFTNRGSAIISRAEDDATHLAKEDMTMGKKVLLGAMILGFMTVLMSLPALSPVALADKGHAAEAVEHAKEAVAHGKQGHADALVKHAEGALKHAEAAQKEKANPHLAEGIKQLKDAVEHGKAGHADVATKAAENAVTHLSEVK